MALAVLNRVMAGGHSVAYRFRDTIPRAELVVIKNAGHVCNMERPEEFNAHVRRFCASSPATA
jgi:pimeloyl-ACP methyl ester carboxylesterase